MRVHRHRYIIEDPARFGCLCAVVALLFLPDPAFWTTLLVIAVTQLAPLMMAVRAVGQGWSRRWGSKVHPVVYTSSLSVDFTAFSACTVVGALLLARHFNGMEGVKPLGVLAVAICFLPDILVCRRLLTGDPGEASRRLRDGSFLRDPVMLGSILATGVVCVVDRVSLQFMMLSLAFLQCNTVLVLLDKYLPEIEARFFSGWKALLLERDGRRLWLALAPFALMPTRLMLGELAAGWGAALIVMTIVTPDLHRLAAAVWQDSFRVTPRSLLSAK